MKFLRNVDFATLAFAGFAVGLIATPPASAQTLPTAKAPKAPVVSTGKQSAVNRPAGGAVATAGGAVVVGSGAHGGAPAPIVSGAVPQTRPFTSSVTDAGAKVGKGMKATGGNIARSGVTVDPNGAARGAAGAPGALSRQADAAGRLVKR